MSKAQQKAKHLALGGEGENLLSPIKYTAKERDGVHAQKRRLANRAKIGANWNGTAANDNIAWPLATALIREGNTELLKAAMYYRKIHDMAKSEAKLGGSSVKIDDGMALDRYTSIRANGSIAYKHVRQRTAAEVDIPAKRYVPPYEDDAEDMQRNSVRIPKPWKGDEPVNNMIDAQSRLCDLRAQLGYLCEPFELACIDGCTLEEVGNHLGTANRSGATAAGRAIVHMALITLRDTTGDLKRSDIT